MKHDYDAYAKLLADSGKGEKVCSWCSSPFHKVQTKGLCGHCYRISKQAKQLKEQIDLLKKDNKDIPWDLHYRHLVAQEMEALAKNESGGFDSQEPFHTGMRIERMMNYISKNWTGHSYYSQYASIFSNFLSPVQRAAVIYLLSRMIREHMRKNRRWTAMDRLADKEIYSLPPPPKLLK